MLDSNTWIYLTVWKQKIDIQQNYLYLIAILEAI